VLLNRAARGKLGGRPRRAAGTLHGALATAADALRELELRGHRCSRSQARPGPPCLLGRGLAIRYPWARSQPSCGAHAGLLGLDASATNLERPIWCARWMVREDDRPVSRRHPSPWIREPIDLELPRWEASISWFKEKCPVPEVVDRDGRPDWFASRPSAAVARSASRTRVSSGHLEHAGRDRESRPAPVRPPRIGAVPSRAERRCWPTG